MNRAAVSSDLTPLIPFLDRVFSITYAPILNLGPPSILEPHAELINRRYLSPIISEWFPEQCFIPDYRGERNFKFRCKQLLPSCHVFCSQQRLRNGQSITSLSDFRNIDMQLATVFGIRAEEIVKKEGCIIIADTCNLNSLGEVRNKGCSGLYRRVQNWFRPYANKKCLVLLNTAEARRPGSALSHAQCFFEEPTLLYSFHYHGRSNRQRRLISVWGTPDSVFKENNEKSSTNRY